MHNLFNKVQSEEWLHLVFSILFIPAPGLLVASLVLLLTPLTTIALWGVIVAGCAVVATLCGLAARWENTFPTYLWLAFVSTVLLLLLGLSLGQDNFVIRAVLLAVDF